MTAENQLPQKRPYLTPDDTPPSKRQRSDSPNTALNIPETPGTYPVEAPSNEYHVYRQTLQRSIALALEAAGFDGASQQALESFTLTTESYLDSLCGDVMSYANHARRSMAIPTDFELTIQDFHIPKKRLAPYKTNAVPLENIRGPEKETELSETEEGRSFNDLPCLSDELSGKGDKESKTYIPSFLPDFPSVHTYQYTPVDIDSVTVKQPFHDSSNPNAPPVPDWRGNPKKIREAAAVQAKQAEEALRKLVRASKVASLKDLRSTAEKNPHSRMRYELWHDAMKDLVGEKKGGGASNGDDAARGDVAGHSMIVNADKKFHRRQVPRSGRKKMVEALAGKT